MSRIRITLTLLLITATAAAQTPLTSAFSYQGRLKLGGNPVNATADFQFSLWDAAGSGSPPAGGTQLGVMQTVAGVTVAEGIFSVVLNGAGEFGASAFDGDARWLQISVRSPAGSGSYSTLAPRQELTAAPHALFALNTMQVCGRPVDEAAPTVNQVLKWDGSFWSPDTDSDTTYTAGPGLTLAATQFRLDLAYADNRFVNEDQANAISNAMLQNDSISTAKLMNGAVTDAKVNDVAWAKITGAPSSFPPSGTAGGDLTGTYPNPTIAAGTVTSAKIADATIATADLANSSVTNAKIADGTIVTADLANASVDSSKIVDGTIATVDLANGAVTTAKVSSSGASAGNALMYNGSSVVWGGPTPGGTAGGDLAGSYPNPTVDGLQGRAVSSAAPSSGQSLQWSGSAWAPANDGITLPYSGSTGSTTSPTISISHSATNNDQPAILASHAVSDYFGVGLRALAGWIGVDVQVLPTGSSQYYGVDVTCAGGSGTNLGVYTDVETSGDAHGVHGTATGLGTYSAYGLYGFATGSGSGTKYGVYATTGGSGTRYAGYFVGNASVTGTLSKGGGSFKIDHPLDPENKYLLHSFVESPDMMNVYNGNVVTDQNGYATVLMPDWFEALNRDFRYQLTVIDEGNSDEFVAAKVVQRIENNLFTIRTSAPYTEVSWQVTGVRHDPFANANRIPVELEKSDSERGLLLHPEAWGQPAEMGVDYVNTRNAKMPAQSKGGSAPTKVIRGHGE